jgi:hypothetical protein
LKTFQPTNHFCEIQLDDEDFDRVTKHNWYVILEPINKVSGIASTIDKKTVYLGRFLLNLTDPLLQADHKDRNVLNNKRSNLRIATKSQNQFNRRITKSNKTSKYHGVCWNKNAGKWQMRLYTGKLPTIYKLFANEEKAAKEYDRLAKLYHGEFAVLNFPEEPKVS